MLGFNHLGRMGQLGNQMFQYAMLSVAAKHGYDIGIPFELALESPGESRSLVDFAPG